MRLGVTQACQYADGVAVGGDRTLWFAQGLGSPGGDDVDL
jgi:hypothetical protein